MDMDDSEMLAAMGISGFGQKKKERTLDPNRFEKNRLEVPVAGPARVQDSSNISEHDSDSEGESAGPVPSTLTSTVKPVSGHDASQEYPQDEEDDLEDDAQPQYPITHSLNLKSHTKPVSALALDTSGARIVSGAHDYDLKLWDFGGMTWNGTTGVRPFKSWEPNGSYHIHDLKYSMDGQKFIAVSGTTQPKLYDRDGEELATFIKGDPYIRDMRHTAGHVGEVTSCAWHPKDPKVFITSSADSTVRIWDVDDKRKQKTVIVIKSKERGARTKVNACAYSNDGGLIAAACLDGAFHLYSANSNFVRPNHTVQEAHVKNTETGSIVFSIDGRTVMTRGGPGDDTLKLWDIRSFRKPLAVRSNLSTPYPLTNAVFSPDEKTILTSAGAEAKGGRGRLIFLRRDAIGEEKVTEPKQLEIVHTLEMAANPVKVCWHSRINQIVVGLSSGAIDVLYSPVTSTNGAKLVLSKGPARKYAIEDMSGALVAQTILTPHALPAFRDGTVSANVDSQDNLVGGWGLVGSKRKRDKDRQDPRKSRRPELPVTGPGKGGRVGASATQHVVQNLVRDTTRDEDPREALLKYATVSNEDPQWTSAWQSNQPKPVFAETPDDERQEEDE